MKGEKGWKGETEGKKGRNCQGEKKEGKVFILLFSVLIFFPFLYSTFSQTNIAFCLPILFNFLFSL